MLFKPTQIEGYSGHEQICSFYEDLGRDQNENEGVRWRVNFYYKPYLAMLKFFSSEESKNQCLAKLEIHPESTGDMIKDYEIFKNRFGY